MPRRGSTDGVVVRRSSARASQPAPRAGNSPWQAPGDLLDPIFERLLAEGEEGTRWLRVASHVCSAWRSAALEVLLADTAISKPPIEDFRAIGHAHSPQKPAKEPKTDTVVTQAAVVMEASASTGVEAISKQRLDWPAAVAGTAAALLRNARAGGTRGAGRAGRGAEAAQHGQHLAAPAAAQQGAQAPEEERGQLAAASPNRLQGGPAPQGSIQSDMVAGLPHRQRLPTESESDGGSTLAQAGPAARLRARRSGRAAARSGSVDQRPAPALPHQQVEPQQHKPQRQASQQRPQRQAGHSDAAGPSAAAAQGRKRAAGGEAGRPRKRQNFQANRQQRAARRERQRGMSETTEELDWPAQQAQHAVDGRKADGRDESGASGLYFEAEGGMEVEQAPRQGGSQQREQQGVRGDGVVGPGPEARLGEVAAPAGQADGEHAAAPPTGSAGRIHSFLKRIFPF